jgi:hypothetical protein
VRRQLYVVILAGVIGFGPLNTVARAQHFPIEGEIVSASASLAALSPPNTTSATVFTTPGSGHFLLTEFCGGPLITNLLGNTFGPIVDGPISNDQILPCLAFHPGVALPKREAIICNNIESPPIVNSNCSISGILEEED